MPTFQDADIQKWERDLRRMTKIYRDVPTDNGPETVKRFQQARRYFVNFSNAFEAWAYHTALQRIPERTDDQTYSERAAAEACWRAVSSLSGLFEDAWDYRDNRYHPAPWLLERNRERRITAFHRAFLRAFKALRGYLELRDGAVDVRPPVERFTVGRVTVSVENRGWEAAEAERLDRFLRGDFRPALDRITRLFPDATRDLTVNLTYRDHAMTAGSYSIETGDITLYPIGWHERTLTHEIGHRFYYRGLPGQAVKHWEEVIGERQSRITEQQIREYGRLFVDGRPPMMDRERAPLILQKTDNEVDLAAYLYLSDHSPGYTSEPDKITEHNLKFSLGDRVQVEHITDYGATNPSEAFAEAFDLYVRYGPRRLGPWTRDFFKKLSLSGGARLGRLTALVAARWAARAGPG